MVDANRAAKGVKSNMRTIPYGHQCINQDDVRGVVKALNSEWITQGPKIAEFESALCDYTGVKFAVAVSSGTAALHIAALSAGLRRGDEAITSPITFAASANCVVYCGAKPVFSDIESETFNISPAEILKKISQRTKVLVPVHFAGSPCDMQQIASIARKNNLLVIEDAAHALGARYKGSKIGSCKYSDMAIFSFHPVKAISTGEGGAVLTNNKRLYQRLLRLRNHGITKDSKLLDRKMRYCGWYYEMQELGFNYRLTDMQAALGISQLKKLDSFIEKRRKIAVTYDNAFNSNPFFDVPKEKKDAFCAYHLYPIRLKKDLELKRDGIFRLLRDKKIGVQVHYIPVYLHPYYKKLGFREGICPVAEDFYKREISLPIYPALTSREVQYIINTVFEVCNLHKNG